MGIIDSLTKNPSLLALAGIGIALFIFRDKISSFASGITGGAKTVSNLGETGNILSENLLGNVTGLQDLLTTNPFENFKFPELPKLDFNFEFPSFELPKLDEIFKTQPISDNDFTSTPQNEARANRSRDFTQTREEAQREIENFNVQTGLETQQTFQGGGLSFIGGTVRETPLTQFSSLSDIINKLGVSASQASDIRARLTPGFFDDFDLGSNTGSGIGSAFPPEFNQGNVSNSSFQGLTAQEIALRLTGGNINNF